MKELWQGSKQSTQRDSRVDGGVGGAIGVCRGGVDGGGDGDCCITRARSLLSNCGDGDEACKRNDLCDDRVDGGVLENSGAGRGGENAGGGSCDPAGAASSNCAASESKVVAPCSNEGSSNDEDDLACW